MHGEENELDIRQDGMNRPYCLDAVHLGHRNIRHDNVRMQFESVLNERVSVRYGVDDVEIRLKEYLKTYEHVQVIICE